MRGGAGVIFAAANDGTHQLRYIYGDDAQPVITARTPSDDAGFMAGIKAQFAR